MSDVLVLIIIGFTGAVMTFYVSEGRKQGPIRSSAVLSLAVAIIFHLNTLNIEVYLAQNIPLVFIGSSFIGMVSSRLVSNYWAIGAGGAVFCIIFLNASRFFTGYGGALGTAACISLLTILSIPIVTKKHRLTNGFALFIKTVLRMKREQK